jgi:pimeloyl-ACP methyl ester carboxylesterase
LILVLLPGLDGTGTLFAPFIQALGPHVPTRVLAYPADRFLGYPELLAWVTPQLPRGIPYVLLGESFSGPVALLIATQRPPALRGLVLCATFASQPRPLLHGAARLPLSALTRWVPEIIRHRVLLGQGAPLTLRRALTAAVERVRPDVLASRLAAALCLQPLADLERITVPALYLRATRDHLVPARAAREMAQRIRHLRRVDIEAPHALVQVAPEAAAAAVRAFLDTVPRV